MSFAAPSPADGSLQRFPNTLAGFEGHSGGEIRKKREGREGKGKEEGTERGKAT